MAMMERIAVVPVAIPSPAVTHIPPTGIISPIPRRSPCIPCGSPEPIVDNRTIYINRLDDIVGSIDILVADNLYGNLVRLIFGNIDRCDILIDILRQDSLEDYQSIVAFTRFHNAEVINMSVTIEVEVAERAIRIVELHLELLQVFSFRKKLSYHLQIQSF